MTMNITEAKNNLRLFDVVFDEVIEDEEEQLIVLLVLENGAHVYECYRFYDNRYTKNVTYSSNGDSCSWQEYGVRW